ncbi:MAG: 50S ribosomal protein L17 [Candidatus Kapaibacteriota bacterium]
MRHLKKGWKLKRTSSHRKALLRNLAISLLEHKKIVTTVAKAKALRPFVEKIITRAKRAVLRERNGQLPEGQTLDVHSRRVVGKLIHNKAIVQELFDTIAPTVVDRPGGYTRIVKLGFRRGDAAELAAIELVDWGAPQDGAVSLKSKKKSASKKKVTTQPTKKSKKTKEEPIASKPEESTIPVEQEVLEPTSQTSFVEKDSPSVSETKQEDETQDTSSEIASDTISLDKTQSENTEDPNPQEKKEE